MIERSMGEFDAQKIACSGQCFRFKCEDDTAWGGAAIPTGEKGTAAPAGEKDATASTPETCRFVLIASGHYLELEECAHDALSPNRASTNLRLSCTSEEFASFWSDYFDLGTDYAAIRALADPSDQHLLAATDYGNGIRILKQDLWEVMVAFIISQNNNIGRITRSVEGLCERFGEKRVGRRLDGSAADFTCFPTPEALSCATSDELSALGLGYRVPYIMSLSREVASGDLDLDELRENPDICSVHARLVGLLGVGPKVASCIELFGLHQLASCPIDTWMRKIIERHYGSGFPWNRYAGYEGVIQQYLFFYERETTSR